MILILKKISPSTRVVDIEEFIEPTLRGGFFRRSGRIISINIQMARLIDSHAEEYQALVNIEPEAVAKRAIRILNRKRCNGKPINVGEYHRRLYHNDRRSSHYQNLEDRRQKDRRRRMELSDITHERKGNAISYQLLNLSHYHTDQ